MSVQLSVQLYVQMSVQMHRTLCVFTPEQDNDKTNVEPVHSYDAFHTRSNTSGVKGIIEMHRFNICFVVLSLSCSGVNTPLVSYGIMSRKGRPSKTWAYS